jgi:hypothetical protein
VLVDVITELETRQTSRTIAHGFRKEGRTTGEVERSPAA